ncbi:MAG: hypothetical protein QXH08_03305 [Candidatus Hadarchaeales archaeon]
MKFETVEKKIRKLGVGEEMELYTSENCSRIYVRKPEKVPKRLVRKIPPELNFQIFLKIPEKEEFRPNHLRVLIDYHLKKKSRPELFRPLISSVEKIYAGEDPDILLKDFDTYNFPMQIDPLDITFYLTQLFMVEQKITWGEGSGQESNYDPPHLFFMGYLRMVFDDAQEIDKICWGAANRNPPQARYTKYDNKKGKEYKEDGRVEE